MCNTAITMPETADKETGFDEWFLTAINGAALMMMISIGHRSGLFEVISNLTWADSEEMPNKACELLEDAGFENFKIHRLNHDIQNDYYTIFK